MILLRNDIKQMAVKIDNTVQLSRNMNLSQLLEDRSEALPDNIFVLFEQQPVVGGGENLRSMAYIDNLAQGLLLAAASSKSVGQTYWIADRRPYSMNEIIDTVERLLETEFGQTCAHKRMRLPGIASQVAWCCDAIIQKSGAYHQKIHVLSEMNKTIACSIEKAGRDLGYDPQIDLEEGMRRSLAEIYSTNGR